MDKLIITRHALETDNDGKLVVKPVPLNWYKTLDELGTEVKKEIDIYINHLKKQCVGHECTHATVVYPLIHVIFDDMNKQNKVYQEQLKTERN